MKDAQYHYSHQSHLLERLSSKTGIMSQGTGNFNALFMEKQMVTVSLENIIEVSNSTWSRNSTPEYPKKLKALKKICPCHVHCSITYMQQLQIQAKCPLVSEWWMVMWLYSPNTDYYSVIKRNEILPFSKTRLALRSIMLSDRYTPYNLTCEIYKISNLVHRYWEWIGCCQTRDEKNEFRTSSYKEVTGCHRQH